MEEKIYDRQVTKQSLSNRVVDQQQIERHYTLHELTELYTFTPDLLNEPKSQRTRRTSSAVPEVVGFSCLLWRWRLGIKWLWCLSSQEKIITELLNSCKDQIVSFHEHESLLDHKVEEELSESERRAAWAEYKAEVTRRAVTHTIWTSSISAANVNATLFLFSSVSQSVQLEPERGKPGHQNGCAAICTSSSFKNVAAICCHKESRLNVSLQGLLNKTRVTVTNAFLSLNKFRSHSLAEYMSQIVRKIFFQFKNHFLFPWMSFPFLTMWSDPTSYGFNEVVDGSNVSSCITAATVSSRVWGGGWGQRSGLENLGREGTGTQTGVLSGNSSASAGSKFNDRHVWAARTNGRSHVSLTSLRSSRAASRPYWAVEGPQQIRRLQTRWTSRLEWILTTF